MHIYKSILHLSVTAKSELIYSILTSRDALNFVSIVL